MFLVLLGFNNIITNFAVFHEFVWTFILISFLLPVPSNLLKIYAYPLTQPMYQYVVLNGYILKRERAHQFAGIDSVQRTNRI